MLPKRKRVCSFAWLSPSVKRDEGVRGEQRVQGISVRGPFRGEGTRTMSNTRAFGSKLDIQIASNDQGFTVGNPSYAMAKFMPKITTLVEDCRVFGVPSILIGADYTE